MNLHNTRKERFSGILNTLEWRFLKNKIVFDSNINVVDLSDKIRTRQSILNACYSALSLCFFAPLIGIFIFFDSYFSYYIWFILFFVVLIIVFLVNSTKRQSRGALICVIFISTIYNTVLITLIAKICLAVSSFSIVFIFLWSVVISYIWKEYICLNDCVRYIRGRQPGVVFPNVSEFSRGSLTSFIKRIHFVGGARRTYAILSAAASVPVSLLLIYGIIHAIKVINPESDIGKFILRSALFYAPITVFAILIRYSLRQIAKDAFETRAMDARQPIVFIRSFKDENIRVGREDHGLLMMVMLLVGPIFGFLYTRRLEEVIELKLNNFGPVIAIGNPSDIISPIGAARHYVKNDQWKVEVERYIKESKFVVAMLGRGDGLVIEMDIVKKISCIDKLILVIPPELNKLEFDKRVERVSDALGIRVVLPASTLLVTWLGGKMTAFTAGGLQVKTDAYETALGTIDC